MNNVKHEDKMGPLHKKQPKHWCTHQRLITLISLNILNRACSAFAKKAWHVITECVAMHDQTEDDQTGLFHHTSCWFYNAVYIRPDFLSFYNVSSTES